VKHPVAGVGFVVAVLVLQACTARVSVGGSGTAAAAEGMIETYFAEQAGLGALSADCQQLDSPQRGDIFACTGTTEAGDVIRFQGVVEEDDSVSVRSLNLVSVEGLTIVEDLAVQALEERVGQTLGRENFECGDRGVVVNPGGVINCVLTDPVSGDRYDAYVTVKTIDPASIDVEVGTAPK
jgi:hypothetical protein